MSFGYCCMKHNDECKLRKAATKGSSADAFMNCPAFVAVEVRVIAHPLDRLSKLDNSTTRKSVKCRNGRLWKILLITARQRVILMLAPCSLRSDRYLKVGPGGVLCLALLRHFNKEKLASKT